MAQGSLVVVGTGMLAAGQVTAEVKSAIRSAERLLFLVQDVVTTSWLLEMNSSAESLAGFYAEGKDRGETYEEMVEAILASVRAGDRVCVAFYGHPGIFVYPGHEAIRRARAEGFDAIMLPGVSSEDCLLADIGFDPGSCGGQSFEASDFLLRRRIFDPTSHLILWQVGAIGVRDFRREPLWNPAGLNVLARVLLESYPPGHEIVVYEAPSYRPFSPKILRQPLVELPGAAVTVRSTLWVPPLSQRPVDPARRAEILMES